MNERKKQERAGPRIRMSQERRDMGYKMIEMYPFHPFINIKMLEAKNIEDAREEADLLSHNTGEYIVLDDNQYGVFLKQIKKEITWEKS